MSDTVWEDPSLQGSFSTSLLDTFEIDGAFYQRSLGYAGRLGSVEITLIRIEIGGNVHDGLPAVIRLGHLRKDSSKDLYWDGFLSPRNTDLASILVKAIRAIQSASEIRGSDLRAKLIREALGIER